MAYSHSPTSKTLKRVLVCDDQPIAHETWRSMSTDPELRIEVDLTNGSSVIHMLSSNPDHYDLAVIDIDLRTGDGLKVLDRLLRTCPQMPVLVYSAKPERMYARTCIYLGACGYVSKYEKIDVLRDAIQRVRDGQLHISAQVATQMVPCSPRSGERQLPHERLSLRELQVFNQILAGEECTQKIAELLSIASNTVSTYLLRLKEKLGVRNYVEMILYAIHHGLLPG